MAVKSHDSITKIVVCCAVNVSVREPLTLETMCESCCRSR